MRRGRSGACSCRGVDNGEARGQTRTIDTAIFEKVFPGFDAKQGAKLKLLYIACGTDDSLIGVNGTFKTWLKGKNISHKDVEPPAATPGRSGATT